MSKFIYPFSLLIAVAVALWAFAAIAQDEGPVVERPVSAELSTFHDPGRIAQWLDNHPDEAVAVLARTLTAEQALAFEDALFPPPSAAEQRRALERVREDLVRAGFDPTDSVVVAVDQRLERATP